MRVDFPITGGIYPYQNSRVINSMQSLNRILVSFTSMLRLPLCPALSHSHTHSALHLEHDNVISLQINKSQHKTLHS